MQIVLEKLFEFRSKQFEQIQNGTAMENITTINLVGMGSSTQDPSVLPEQLWVAWDMRIRITEAFGFEEVEELLEDIQTAAELGREDSVSMDWISYTRGKTVTNPDPANIWWVAVQAGCEQL